MSDPTQTTLAVMAAHFARQRAWSLNTFGPGTRAAGVLDHIRKELQEIEAEPLSLEEWIDVAILAFDGAWRAGHAPEDIAVAWLSKQAKNEARDWPDWRTMPVDRAIEHVRAKLSGDATPHGPSREMTLAEVALFEQGFAAHADGIAHDLVPGFPDIEDRRWWLRGWYAARDDNGCIYGR